MRKALLLVAFLLISFTQTARAQFCPGVSPWVFDDVTASDPFCGFITWMAENGITLGCQIVDANHRLYCPNANVSRAAMAAFMNRLGNIRVEAVDTGPGLTGGPITSTGTINLAATQLLPTTACASGQVAQWNGSAWACANTSGGGGTVTSVGSGTGLAGGPITTSGSLSIAGGYQLPQGCSNGQVAKSNGAGSWTCASDANSGGTVTSVATGAGLTGGPITASGTINLAATQLLPTVACSAAQIPSWNGNAWTCGDPNAFPGNVNLSNSTSAAIGNVLKNGARFIHNFGTNGTFLGVNAGNFSMTGINNTALGYVALNANTSGTENTAVGSVALPLNTTGANNTGVGYVALANNTTGSFNTGVGRGALALNTTASNNTGLGTNALNLTTTGGDNTATGAFALNSNTTGNSNTSAGSGALYTNTTGNSNTAVGAYAMVFNTVGDFNAAIGGAALNQNTTGSANVAVGQGTASSNTTGSYNVGVGAGVLTANQTGSGNTAIGTNALAQNITDNNTAVGREALANNTTGSLNTAVGNSALFSSTTGFANTAVGATALASTTTGNQNVAIGTDALSTNTTGQQNTAVGKGAMILNTAGGGNAALGTNALNSNTAGASNAAVGRNALASNTTGSLNTAIGMSALSGNTTGGFNVAIGQGAGSSLTTGNFNINIAHGGVAGDTQTIRIGDIAQTRTFLAGIRGVTTGNNDAINVVVDSNGQLGTLSSSRSVKDDIVDMGDASGVLMNLHPVTFRYKAHDGAGPVQYGLIAEEVADVAPGLVAAGRDGKIETVLYQHLAPMLLNEFQKQQRTIEAQAAEIAELRRAVEVLMARASPEGRVAAR